MAEFTRLKGVITQISVVKYFRLPGENLILNKKYNKKFHFLKVKFYIYYVLSRCNTIEHNFLSDDRKCLLTSYLL